MRDITALRQTMEFRTKPRQATAISIFIFSSSKFKKCTEHVDYSGLVMTRHSVHTLYLCSVWSSQ
jgi:hypothetical protein